MNSGQTLGTLIAIVATISAVLVEHTSGSLLDWPVYFLAGCLLLALLVGVAAGLDRAGSWARGRETRWLAQRSRRRR